MASEPDALRGFNYDTAETLASSWESRRAQIEQVSAPVREWVIKELEPAAGDTVLELAAGTGDTGFEVSRLIGAEGWLITTDFSPAMLEAARRRGAELGIDNAEFKVMDAEHLDLDDDAVDRVLCRFGYMLMVDPAAALDETRRVLRGGGRLALAVWGPPEVNPFFTTIAMPLIQRGHIAPPAPPPAPGMFSMGAEARTRTLLAEAGFKDIRVEAVNVLFPMPDVDEYMGIVADTAGPLALVLRSLSEEERGELAAEVETSLSRFASADGYDIPGQALCAVAG